jgi:hypothetical protein
MGTFPVFSFFRGFEAKNSRVLGRSYLYLILKAHLRRKKISLLWLLASNGAGLRGFLWAFDMTKAQGLKFELPHTN